MLLRSFWVWKVLFTAFVRYMIGYFKSKFRRVFRSEKSRKFKIILASFPLTKSHKNFVFLKLHERIEIVGHDALFICLLKLTWNVEYWRLPWDSFPGHSKESLLFRAIHTASVSFLEFFCCWILMRRSQKICFQGCHAWERYFRPIHLRRFREESKAWFEPVLSGQWRLANEQFPWTWRHPDHPWRLRWYETLLLTGTGSYVNWVFYRELVAKHQRPDRPGEEASARHRQPACGHPSASVADWKLCRMQRSSAN